MYSDWVSHSYEIDASADSSAIAMRQLTTPSSRNILCPTGGPSSCHGNHPAIDGVSEQHGGWIM